MIRCLIFLMILLSSLQAKAFSWSDLWYTPDQQAQHLMEKGQFKKAKETFERNDWIGSAAYRAGDYEQAAELFKELNNEQGYYNQGNALAHMGQYEQAIDAYNKALKINPDNQDALYNRKLLEELLKKDKEQKQNKDKDDKNQNNKDQQNKDQQNKDQQNKDQQNKDQQNKDQQNKDQQNKDQQNKDQQNKDQQNNKQDQSKKNEDQQEGDAQSEAEQEKQQAKQQWLRLIPDDPGGLLREKFLRDHLRRERGWYQ
ncbi:tetratricopeptide repeat protein [Legionella moravica]|uniref:tetratricopeptide repeat protein n=1 Tax=Legionella moravica TaxID=39962 RepID=UPI0010543C3F|nr:tetratricopeptide repeat protein [Legionella moravica]